MAIIISIKVAKITNSEPRKWRLVYKAIFFEKYIDDANQLAQQQDTSIYYFFSYRFWKNQQQAGKPIKRP
jgi:hypothetical protein